MRSGPWATSFESLKCLLSGRDDYDNRQNMTTGAFNVSTRWRSTSNCSGESSSLSRALFTSSLIFKYLSPKTTTDFQIWPPDKLSSTFFERYLNGQISTAFQKNGWSTISLDTEKRDECNHHICCEYSWLKPKLSNCWFIETVIWWSMATR